MTDTTGKDIVDHLHMEWVRSTYPGDEAIITQLTDCFKSIGWTPSREQFICVPSYDHALADFVYKYMPITNGFYEENKIQAVRGYTEKAAWSAEYLVNNRDDNSSVTSKYVKPSTKLFNMFDDKMKNKPGNMLKRFFYHDNTEISDVPPVVAYNHHLEKQFTNRSRAEGRADIYSNVRSHIYGLGLIKTSTNVRSVDFSKAAMQQGVPRSSIIPLVDFIESTNAINLIFRTNIDSSNLVQDILNLSCMKESQDSIFVNQQLEKEYNDCMRLLRVLMSTSSVLITSNGLIYVIRKYSEISYDPVTRRLHCEDGPALKFEDANGGIFKEFYFINDVRVPKKVVLTPDLLNKEEIDMLNNDARPIAIQRTGGIINYLQKYAESNKIIDSAIETCIGTLETLILSDGQYYLIVVDPAAEHGTDPIALNLGAGPFTTCAQAQRFLHSASIVLDGCNYFEIMPSNMPDRPVYRT